MIAEGNNVHLTEGYVGHGSAVVQLDLVNAARGR